MQKINKWKQDPETAAFSGPKLILAEAKWKQSKFKFFLEIIDITSSSLILANSSKVSICVGMRCINAHGMGNLHLCEGTINVEW